MKKATFKAVVTGCFLLAGQGVFGQTQAVTAPSQMVVTATPAEGYSTARIAVPSDVQVDTIAAKLNGNDITARFTRVNCPRSFCEQATLTEADGLHATKNVLQVVAKRTNGTYVSARERFSGTASAVSAVRAQLAASIRLHPNAVNALPTLSR